MIRDILRAALATAVMAAGASIVIEARYQLACVDVAHRQCLGQQIAVTQLIPQPGRLRQVGRAAIELADAALGVVR